MVNVCLNWVKTRLALKVWKLGSSALCTNFVKLNSPDFLSFPPLLSTTLLLSILVAGRALAAWELVFNIEVSRAVTLLKPWMKR